MRLSSFAAAGFVIATASPAAAYRRQAVDTDPSRGLLWEDRAIPIELAVDSSDDVAPGDLRAALARSLATWTEPGCSDVVLRDDGDAPSLVTNLVDGRADGVHRIVIRESGWPDEVGAETLAITSLVYERDTGRILDADIDLNASAHVFSAGAVARPDADDVENTLTHELGHLLGLAHVEDPEATMHSGAELGETRKRDLSPDDLLGLCETYPTGRPTPSVLPAPTPSGGCSVGARTTPSAWPWALFGVSARAAWRWRRRARAA